MDTNELVEALVADLRKPGPSLSSVWWVAAGLGVILAGILFFVTLGPRPDFAAATQTPRFVFKFVVTITLALVAFRLVRKLSYPGEPWRGATLHLAAAPALLVVAVIVELMLLPPDVWLARLVGRNSLICLTYIPLIGIGPLAAFIAALRYGAPTRPALAGAVAGLLAGGLAATFYAAHCTDDSPLFVATWYTIAIAGVALVGAVGGNRFARW
jgi:hypothetical protein